MILIPTLIKMKNLLGLITLAVVGAALVGCVESLGNSHFKVECKISPELGTDSVSLMLVMADYNSVHHVATVSRDIASQAFVFEGNVETPTIAYLKFSNDTTPMFFVVEPGVTQIDITPTTLIINGGDANHDYITYLKVRAALVAERQKLHQEYLSHVAADSTIEVGLERQYFSRDSALTDSLERITVDAINRGDLTSTIIFERYVNSLTRKNLQNIHKK